MPRTARAIEAGLVYHVLNRGNGRMRLFHKDDDYAAFEWVLAEGLERYPIDLFTYCVMPNHWHLVVRPHTDEALGHAEQIERRLFDAAANVPGLNGGHRSAHPGA